MITQVESVALTSTCTLTSAELTARYISGECRLVGTSQWQTITQIFSPPVDIQTCKPLPSNFLARLMNKPDTMRHIRLDSEGFYLFPLLRTREVFTPSRHGIIFSRASNTSWSPTSYCNVDGIRSQRLADELNVSKLLIGHRITFPNAV